MTKSRPLEFEDQLIALSGPKLLAQPYQIDHVRLWGGKAEIVCWSRAWLHSRLRVVQKAVTPIVVPIFRQQYPNGSTEKK